MLALHDLQKRFAAALFEEVPSVITPWIRSGAIPAEERLAIYRNNLRVGFAKALALGFPVLERLVGETFFRQLARDYQLRHPSSSGDLNQIGARFADWLDLRFRDTQYGYFPDVARLEWAYQEVSVAAPQALFGLEQLAQLPPASHAALQLRLHSAARLIASPYPILRIWTANQPDAEAQESIDVSAGGESVLIHRTPAGVFLRPLEHMEFRFLAALDAGIALGPAADAALSRDHSFDLAAVLRRAFTHQLFASTFERLEEPHR